MNRKLKSNNVFPNYEAMTFILIKINLKRGKKEKGIRQSRNNNSR